MTTPALPPESAIPVVRAFIEASNRRDVDGMKQYLSKGTIESGQFHGEAPELERYDIKGVVVENGEAIVPVELFAKSPPPGQPKEMTMPFVLIPEGGTWRIDIPRTMNRLFGGNLDELLQKMAGAMKTAMEGMAGALEAGLKEVFDKEKKAHPRKRT